MSKRYLLASLLLLLALTGCRSRREMTRSSDVPVVSSGLLSQQALFSEALTRHNTDTSAVIKGVARLTFGNGKVSCRVQIRWSRDRALQVSVLPLMGIEMGRVVFTPDSIYVIDRFHKRYIQESVADCQRQISFDISFATLQSLFLAQPFLPGGVTKPQDINRYEVTTYDAGYRYTYAAARPAGDYRFDIDTLACLEVMKWTTPSREQALMTTYSDYLSYDGKSQPSQASFALSGFLPYPVLLSLEKMNSEWNLPPNISTAASSKYKRTELKTWIETLLRL